MNQLHCISHIFQEWPTEIQPGSAEEQGCPGRLHIALLKMSFLSQPSPLLSIWTAPRGGFSLAYIKWSQCRLKSVSIPLAYTDKTFSEE